MDIVCHNFLAEYALGNHCLSQVIPRGTCENGTIFLVRGRGLGLTYGDFIAFNYNAQYSIDHLGNFVFFVGQVKNVIVDKSSQDSDFFQIEVEARVLSEETAAELNYARVRMLRIYRDQDNSLEPKSDSRDFGYVIHTDLFEKNRFRESIEKQLSSKGGR